MLPEERKTVQIKVTVTPEEYAILEEFAKHQGKPLAGAFMAFVREANTFKVIAKTNKALETISGFKSSFKDRVKNVFAS